MTGLSLHGAALARESATGASPESDAVRPLAAISEQDRARYGDKAWHLARLARAGLPVPAGFCIPGDVIPAAWSDADNLPPALAQAIRREYADLGSPCVAAR